LDHLIGAQQERLWDSEPQHLGCGQVDDEIELGRLLDRKVARFRTAKNLVDIIAGAPEQVRVVCPIGHQTSCFHKLSPTAYRRESRAEDQGVDANPMRIEEPVGSNIKRIRASLVSLDSRRDILCTPDSKGD